jgi:hypothetical protein
MPDHLRALPADCPQWLANAVGTTEILLKHMRPAILFTES